MSQSGEMPDIEATHAFHTTEALTHVWGDTWYCLPDKDLRQAPIRDATSCNAST